MKLTKLNIGLSEADIERLDFISKYKYRGVSRTQTIRFLIEDCWTSLAEEVSSKEVDVRQGRLEGV